MFSRYCFVDGLVEIKDSNKKFFINYLGQIKNSLGNDVPFKVDKNGYKIVFIKSWDGEREYKVGDLIVTHFKDLRIPKEFYNKIVSFHLNGDKNDTSAKNIGYRFTNGKLEVVNYPGYYYVPGFTIIAINIHGEAINSQSGMKLKWALTKQPAVNNKNITGGYYYLGSVGGDRRGTTLLRHRAMGLVFLDYSDNCDKLVVNHKDGIPGNDWLSNLEWITRGGNLIHAYENNLRNQNKTVLARNVLTGEIKEFYSISECSRVFGYATDETIRQRLISSDFCKVFSDGFQFKYKEDLREWVIPKEPLIEIKRAQDEKGRIIKYRNCLTMQVIDGVTIKQASEQTKVNAGSISYKITNNSFGPIQGFQFMESTDAKAWKNFSLQEYHESLKPTNTQVIARNHRTGKELFFDSIRKAAEALNRRGIIQRLRDKQQPLYSDGWQFKYSDDPWIEIEDIDKALYLCTNEVTAKHEQSNKIFIADSCRQMAKVLKLDAKAIKTSALTRGNTLYKGYRFRLGIDNSPWPN